MTPWEPWLGLTLVAEYRILANRENGESVGGSIP